MRGTPTCRIFGIKNCDTMKKAFACLDAQGTAYEFVDYKKAGVVAERLPDWLQQADWQTLLNTRGLMWKKLSAAERTDVDAAKASRLMTSYPALIKRPVLDLGEMPDVDTSTWKLEVGGLVENPFTLTWEQLLALPQVEDVSDFHCVTAWSRYDNHWRGVRFRTIAELAVPRRYGDRRSTLSDRASDEKQQESDAHTP